MRLAALVLLLAVAPGVARAEKPASNLIVWGGGTERADAERWLSWWNDPRTGPGRFVTLAPGFPRIDDSSTVEGLKPGFSVVTLGVCSPQQTSGVLQVLKGLAERTYARPIAAAPAAGACPRVKLSRFIASDVREGPGGNRVHLLLADDAGQRRLIITLRSAAGEGLDLDVAEADYAKVPAAGENPDPQRFPSDGKPELWFEVAPGRGCQPANYVTHENWLVVDATSIRPESAIVQTCD